MLPTFPSSRLRDANDRPVRPGASIVLYWMIAARRPRFNFGLQRAADWARHLGRPLLVLEALRVDYPWASDRLHRFVIDGMADHVEAFAAAGAAYLPYVEPEPGAGRGLLAALADDAAIVVTDEYPTFFLPRMVAGAAERLPVRLQVVDSNGLIPLSVADGEFATAYAFRRFVQRTVRDHLEDLPLEDPLAEALPAPGAVPGKILERWPAASKALLGGDPGALAGLPIDHEVGVVELRGGPVAGGKAMQRFLDEALDDYAERRNRPDDGRSSGLSPYLHFGHVAAHEVVLEVLRRERWSPEDVVGPDNGRRAGWWGMSESAEAFLDQVVTWRELGYQFCHHREDHERWSSLPGWAQATLAEHAGDGREHVYGLEAFAGAATHDELWNAAQRQLQREGTIQNYLRMLWGKKILEWTEHPEDALAIMLELNNRFAVDGRDPNSVSGIFWVLGRHDRAWGPERPVFGKVRYMSSANTARKLPVAEYLERYGGKGEGS
ncbi:MAG TPA: deoxyribodipyrimidine photolyase [Methylomirabilota bacterium]|nr:deoxyribodipyrimidine photolyase [Methylomirabilota bacterium]